ncbi:helix-turn-helix domain-containing protein [Pseudomaricurvus alkylphenolicus]|uniref:helix-turn-helix domain-containing protein n=1 Tax=Pseudomaricurvus alkylphenolicus TaxID=1306991 RepID=UPI001421262D|nr:helix-turn-helix domain-containing protein [Pseudomaricurvus alkylphenolicus]NIB38345.1 helix-turn-helix domain-containing protein [Pseudomaricurvus alkylphenolicus]
MSITEILKNYKLNEWQQLVSEHLGGIDLKLEGSQECRAGIRENQFGELSFTELYTVQSVVVRQNIQADEQHASNYFLFLLLGGTIRHSQQHKTFRRRGKILTLVDAVNPYTALLSENVHSLIITLPGRLLLPHLPNLETAILKPKIVSRGLATIAWRFIMDLWEEREFLTQEERRRQQSQVIKLVAQVLRLSSGDPAPGKVRVPSQLQLTRIYNYMDDHLHEQGLNANQIAEALGISRRYLHHLLEQCGQTVGQRILQQRLERCRLAFLDPVHDHTQLTEIAVQHGFSSLSHFSRTFKTRFGVSPSEYRKRKLVMHEGEQVC